VKIQGGWLESGVPFSMSFQLEAPGAGIRFENDVVVVTDHASKERQIDLAGHDAYEKQLSYFLQCCRTGHPPDLCPPVQSRAAVQVALRLRQSQLLGGAEIACKQ
jgi:hypothetical protein